MTRHSDFDVLIIGSGIAGLTLALRLAPLARVGLICKDELLTSSSHCAQGGVAAVVESQDFASHIADTLTAGAGLCIPATVEFTVHQAPQAIHWLIEQGVQFTRDSNNPSDYHLTREGGHSCRRIYHVADNTGAAIVQTLARRVQEHPNITCLTNHMVVDLLIKDQHCYGIKVLSGQQDVPEKLLLARTTVLATGGASAVYLYTSNPNTSCGDGLAMAWRAGCRLANLEFNQFHPTSLYHPHANSFLISEAVRGEGGVLRLPTGKRFMPEYDARAELAPRDIVARAITLEMQQHQLQHVLLDISHKPSEQIRTLFPMIMAQCQQFGFDITQQAIPVVPAAHYTCGGVITDHSAHTDIQNLYAIGEVSCTGLHGANRMASNSLLECLVFAASASEAISAQLQQPTSALPKFKLANVVETMPPMDPHHIQPLTQQLRQMMSTHLGIIRSNHSIAIAQQHLTQTAAFFAAYAMPATHQTAWLSLRNCIEVAQLMVESARLRQESRGAHYNIDYPQTLNQALPTLLSPEKQAKFVL